VAYFLTSLVILKFLRLPLAVAIVMPAEAGIRPSNDRAAEGWVTASAGTTKGKREGSAAIGEI